ncbi:MAG: matrixin family metalloprotease [bacterium]
MSGLASRCAARLALAALTLGLTGFAHIRTADRADAPYLRWSQGFEVPIHVHQAGYSALPFADVRRALERSLATWTAVNGSTLTFIRDPAGRDGDTPAMDGVNMIRFEERALPPEIDPDSVLAWTTPVSVACTGVILEADITFNAVSFRWATADNARANDIETVSLHEVGHLLGLDHSNNRDAVMFPRCRSGSGAASTPTISRASAPSTPRPRAVVHAQRRLRRRRGLPLQHRQPRRADRLLRPAARGRRPRRPLRLGPGPLRRGLRQRALPGR